MTPAHPSSELFFKAIGRVVYCWSNLERAVDILQDVAIAVGRDYGQTQQPQLSLSRKARLIRKIYKSIPDITPFFQW
jgi:hypothetical protein